MSASASITVPEEAQNTIGNNSYVQQETKRKPLITFLLPETLPEDSSLNPEEIKEVFSRQFDDSFLKLIYPSKQQLRCDDPIPNQKISLVTFIPSPWAKPDKNGLYGVLKIRQGCHSEEEMSERGLYYISYVDTSLPVDQGPAGKPLP